MLKRNPTLVSRGVDTAENEYLLFRRDEERLSFRPRTSTLKFARSPCKDTPGTSSSADEDASQTTTRRIRETLTNEKEKPYLIGENREWTADVLKVNLDLLNHRARILARQEQCSKIEGEGLRSIGRSEARISAVSTPPIATVAAVLRSF